MDQPPSSVTIEGWEHGMSWSPSLFPVDNTITITAATYPNTGYVLAWGNEYGTQRSMTLPNWNSTTNVLSGSPVTIYGGPDENALITGVTVTVTFSSDGDCTGTLSGGKHDYTANPGTFVAEATPPLGDRSGEGS